MSELKRVESIVLHGDDSAQARPAEHGIDPEVAPGGGNPVQDRDPE